MRAIFLEPTEIKQAQLEIEGPRFHHLAQVVRVKKDENILALDGLGHKATAKVIAIHKKNLLLEIEGLEYSANQHFLTALIGCPKKEAVLEILRRGTELGLKRVIFYHADHSPWSYSPSDRFDKVIESALIQSNNLWAPEVVSVANGQLASTLSQYQRGLWLHLASDSKGLGSKDIAIDLICIGPEAGWSTQEEEVFSAQKNLHALRLQTPILRAEHALSVASGYVLATSDI